MPQRTDWRWRNYCKYPRPKILTVEPTTCVTDQDSYITFSFQSPKDYIPPIPNCMFGPRVVTPSQFNGTHGICQCPESIPGVYPFSLSFDRKHWAKEKFNITFVHKGYTAQTVFGTIEIVLISIALILICWWYIPKALTSNLEDCDQILPLNKWHTSQSTHEKESETNFFRYLLNLLL